MPHRSREFAAYVPRLIFRDQARTADPPAEASGERFPAVAVFADVAGSTVMANRLAKIGGLVGPEEMCRILNAYYEPLINIFEEHGGDVVGFAGDAVLAVWPSPAGGDLAGPVLRATRASVRIQEQLNDLELAADVRLALRISIGAGELSTALVGGCLGFWQLVCYGEPLDQIRESTDAQQIGRVFVSATAVAAAGRRITVDRAKGGGLVRWVDPAESPDSTDSDGLMDLSRLPESVLRAYVPKTVQESVDHKTSAFLGQTRRVSTLFVRVFRPPGTTPQWDRMQLAMAALQEAMRRYQGTVSQLMEDDKGLIAVLTFGLPPFGHEDDAARAVAAAAYLREIARNRGVQCGIGVSTGLPFCGPLGGPARRVYTVTGADVIRAARLMQAARNGEILCDSETRSAAGPLPGYRLAPLPRVWLKGFDAPARVFHVLAPGDPPPDPDEPVRSRLRAEAIGPLLAARLGAESLPADAADVIDRLLCEGRLVVNKGVCELDETVTPADPAENPADVRQFVGREAERSALAAALEETAGGVGCVVLIEGELGAGKSRLLGEARAFAAGRGLPVFSGVCSAIETATPYFPWRAVLDESLGLTAGSARKDREARVRDALSDRADVWPIAPLLNDLLGITLPDDGVVRQMTGQTRADALGDVIVGLLAAATGGRPAVIGLDDAHYADPSSWRLGRVVRERLPTITFVLAADPGHVGESEAYASLAAAADVRRLPLAPLTEGESQELARLRFGADRLDPATAELVWKRSRGSPLYVEQVTDHLAATRMVVVDAGTARLTADPKAGTGVGVPDTIRGLVTARIDRLRPPHRVTAKVFSVIGPVFPWRASEAVHADEAATGDLPGHADALTRERILQELHPPPDAVHTFPHPLVRQVCYDLLDRPLRSKFHRRMAEWLESDTTETGPLEDRLIAYHWEQAGEPDRQVEYLARAGAGSLRAGAFREAVTGYADLLRLSRGRYGDAAPPAERAARAHWEFQLGEAYFGLGEMPAAAEHLANALALHGRPVPTSTAGLVADAVVQLAVQFGRRAGPFRRRTRPPAGNDPAREAAAAYNRLGRVRYYMNEVLPGTHAVLRALNLTERVGPPAQQATAYASAMILTGLLSRKRTAQLYAGMAEAVARGLDELSHRSVVFAYLCMHHLGQGHWDKVDTIAREALGYAEQLRDHTQITEVATVLAMLSCMRSDYPAAERWAARMIEESARSRNGMHAAWALNIQGECCLRLGRPEEAVGYFHASAAALAGNNARTEEVRIHGMLAGMAARAGDWAAADGHAAAIEAVFREASVTTCSTLEGFAGLAEARFLRAEADPRDPAARAAATAALKAFRKYARPYPVGGPRLAVYEGRARRLAGSARAAAHAWKRGLKLAEKLAMPYDIALLHETLGRHAAPGSAEHREHRRAAIDAYTRLGMAAEAERLADRG